MPTHDDRGDTMSTEPDEASERSSAPALPATSYPPSKRLFDVVVAAIGLVLALPVLVGIRIAMAIARDGGPFIYRAPRVGESGRQIEVLKIRTMRRGAPGLRVTMHDDTRITPVGRTLRRYKLDELPQLWNVLTGTMAIVGPRPEDPTYVDFSHPLHRRVFAARPGITGLAQLEFRNESELLRGPGAEEHYRNVILPAKLIRDAEYLAHASAWLDLKILIRTVFAVIRSPGSTQT